MFHTLQNARLAEATAAVSHATAAVSHNVAHDYQEIVSSFGPTLVLRLVMSTTSQNAAAADR